MIRIITNTTYGFRNGVFIEPKTKDSVPFSVTPEREAELVAMGVAEYVEQDETVVPTVSEAEQAEDGESVSEAEQEDFEVTLEYLQGLKLADLKKFAEQFGITFKVGTKKDDFAQIVYDAIGQQEDGEPVVEEEQAEDSEQPPTINPEDSVV